MNCKKSGTPKQPFSFAGDSGYNYLCVWRECADECQVKCHAPPEREAFPGAQPD